MSLHRSRCLEFSTMDTREYNGVVFPYLPHSHWSILTLPLTAFLTIRTNDCSLHDRSLRLEILWPHSYICNIIVHCLLLHLVVISTMMETYHQLHQHMGNIHKNLTIIISCVRRLWLHREHTPQLAICGNWYLVYASKCLVGPCFSNEWHHVNH